MMHKKATERQGAVASGVDTGRVMGCSEFLLIFTSLLLTM
jgi:hypothetical protein